MVEPRAFIAIEQTMAAAMRAQWDKRAATLAATLQPLVDAGKWGDAQAAVNKLTLAGVVEDVRPRIEELAVTAVLFGAHHAAGSLKANERQADPEGGDGRDRPARRHGGGERARLRR